MICVSLGINLRKNYKQERAHVVIKQKLDDVFYIFDPGDDGRTDGSIDGQRRKMVAGKKRSTFQTNEILGRRRNQNFHAR